MLVVLAAALAAVALPGTPSRQAERTPNLFKLPPGCAAPTEHVVDQYGRPVLLPILGRPGSAMPELAVMRMVDGCPVRTVRNGKFVPVQPEPSLEAWRLRPSDEPPNRR